MADNSPFSYFCAEDYNGWAREALVNCDLSLFDSGVLEVDNEFDNLCDNPGWAGEGIFWSTQGDLTEDISTPEVDGDCAPCTDLMQKKERWHKMQFNKCWTIKELQKACNRARTTPGDEMQAVMADYGRSLVSKAALSMIHGVYQGNLANDGGDLVYDATTSAVDTNFLSPYASISAEELVGCCDADLPLMLMHCDVFNNLRKAGAITNVQVDCNDGQCVNRAFFENKRVESINSDCLKDGENYITAMMRPGALGLGRCDLDNGMTQDYDDCADGGTGQEFIYTRDQMILHMRGFSNEFNRDGSLPRITPNFADLKDGANFCRSVEANNSPIVFVTSTEA